jgi:hypothetical protein
MRRLLMVRCVVDGCEPAFRRNEALGACGQRFEHGMRVEVTTRREIEVARASVWAPRQAHVGKRLEVWFRVRRITSSKVKGGERLVGEDRLRIPPMAISSCSAACVSLLPQ